MPARVGPGYWGRFGWRIGGVLALRLHRLAPPIGRRALDIGGLIVVGVSG